MKTTTSAAKEKDSAIKEIIRSLGLVFGDIGTSPIYTLTIIFILLKPTEVNVVGVLSLVLWTMTVLVTIEYGWLAMGLGEKGEGGAFVLRGILVRLLKKTRSMVFVTVITFIGVSLLAGDGVITPAISILSAVEGILLIPGFSGTKQTTLIVIAGVIAIILFAFQKKGTDKVAGAFGPLMVAWFVALSVSGILSIAQAPSVLKAVNPWYAVKFLYHNGISGFFVLSEVILCATGGEALYADMGHLGRKPIIRAWYFVFFALALSYLGQGSFILKHQDGATNTLFGMVLSQSVILYVPFLVLSILATVIASQAMISGMFSIVYQGINTRLLPMFKVEYTSPKLRSQIYIGFVNWFLLLSVLFIMFEFRESHRLAAAYGLAVTGTMALTGIMMTAIFHFRREWFKMFVSILVTIVDLIFLVSNTYKVPHGGYWSIVIALVPLVIMLVYTAGQRRLYRKIRPLPLDVFLESYSQVYRELNRISGTALYFARDPRMIPPYIVHTMFRNHIIYETNVIVSIKTLDQPFGVRSYFEEKLADGLEAFRIEMGYMEVVKIEEIIQAAGINEKVIFYGLEEIATDRPVWKAFSILKRLTPPFIQFHDLPLNKLHGVITRVEM